MARPMHRTPEVMGDSKLRNEPAVGRDQYDHGPISVRDKRTGEDKLLVALRANESGKPQ